MLNLYETGLLLARLLGAVNLIVGIAVLIAALLIGAIGFADRSGLADNVLLGGVILYLLEYGTAALVAGIAVLLVSKRIARLASKS